MSKPRQQKWNANDKFAFATQRLRANTVPGQRHNGPTADEWDYTDEEEDNYGSWIQR